MSLSGKAIGMIRRGVLTSSRVVDGALRLLQATVQGTAVDDVEQLEPYGLAAVAPAGAHVLIVHVGADESHPVAVAASSPAHRPSGMTAGQVALYDSTGKVVMLSTSGIQLGTSASKGVARTGDTIAVSQSQFLTWISQVTTYINTLTPGTITPFVGSPTGTITSGSAVVKAVD